MKIKKALSMVMLSASLLSFVGCGNGQDSNSVVQNNNNSMTENQNSEKIQQLEIKDSGWTVVDDEWLYYYVDLYNPNDNSSIEYPSFRISAKDASGTILGTDDQTCSIIYPKQDFVYGSQAFRVDGIPDTVEFSALPVEDYNVKKSSTDKYKPLEAVNTAVRSDKIVGEIKNDNNDTFDDAVVVMLLKDGSENIVGIDNTYVEKVAANSTTPFDMDIPEDVNYASFEIYVNQW